MDLRNIGLFIGVLWIFMGGWGMGGVVNGQFPMLAGVLVLILVAGGGTSVWLRVNASDNS